MSAAEAADDPRWSEPAGGVGGVRASLQRVLTGLRAEVGAVVVDGSVVVHAGHPGDGHLAGQLVAAATGRADAVESAAGRLAAAVAPLEGVPGGALVLARPDPFRAAEREVLAAVADAVAHARRAAAALEAERERGEFERRRAEREARLAASLDERGALLERLSRIQRSISHRAPLQKVLDAITAGTVQLLGDELAGIRVVDPEDPRCATLLSAYGVREELLPVLRRGPVGQGAGGRAVAEGRLVVVEDYQHDPNGLPEFVEDRLQAAMAAPVHENGKVIGSLTTASYQPGRRYSAGEQEALTALAEHASLALSDAKMIEAMREARHAQELFLAMASHELKTPLTVILATLRTLQRHHESLSTRECLDMVATAVRRGEDLERLVDRLLQGSRGTLAGARQPVRLPGLVAEAVQGFEHARPLRRGPVPDVVAALDAAGLQAVLGTLLENAVEHSPPGGEVAVDVTLDGQEARFAVTNAGRLPADVEPEALFLPFQRASASASGGVGLGLYIAARLTESMGGRIECHAEGGSVTFALRVPLQPPGPDPAAEGS